MIERSSARFVTRTWVEELAASGALEAPFARIDAGEIELTGDGGLIPGLIKVGPSALAYPDRINPHL
nr:hypothetical protein [Kribbella sp. VKM Ac-2571]